MMNRTAGRPESQTWDRRDKGAVLFLAVATLLLFAPACQFEFVNYDDARFVTDNLIVLQGLTWNGIQWALGSQLMNCSLAWLSHMVDVELFGLNSGAHHAVNIVWHTGATVVLFLALRQLGVGFGPSAVVAALFAWHPLHVESVAWVAERKDVMCGFFWFLTLLAYGRHVKNPTWRTYGATLAAFVLGLLSKPMIVTLPCVLLLLDYWPLRRWPGQAGSRPVSTELGATGRAGAWWPLLAEKAPFFGLMAIASIATFQVVKESGDIMSLQSLPAGARIANAMVGYTEYVRQALWPVDLAVLYPLPETWPVWRVLVSAATLVLVTGCALLWSRTRPWLAVGWMWFLGTLVPVVGFVQIGGHSTADRYSYIPLVGLFLMVAVSVGELWTRRPNLRLLWGGLTAVALLASAVMMELQLRHWRDSFALFQRALQVRPNSGLAHNNLGAALAEAGRISEAGEHFAKAARLDPNWASPQFNVARFLESTGRHSEARQSYEALLIRFAGGRDARATLARFENDVLAHPNDPEAHYRMACAAKAEGRIQRSIESLSQVVRLKPDYIEAQLELAQLQTGLGRLAEAARHYETALKAAPENDIAQANLGGLLSDMGRPDLGFINLSAALRLNPSNAATRYNAAVALLRLDRTAEAIVQLREVLRLKPNSATALTKLSWVLATHADSAVRNGREALDLAERANGATTRREPLAVDALAAALAECGRFGEAVTAAEQAALLATAAGQTNLAAASTSRAALYRAGQPFRDNPAPVPTPPR